MLDALLGKREAEWSHTAYIALHTYRAGGIRDVQYADLHPYMASAGESQAEKRKRMKELQRQQRS